MKTIQNANTELLHHLFDWKRKNGELIRYSIEKGEERWILSFFSVDQTEQDKHVFASFEGKNHDELNKWVLDVLVSYQLSVH